MRKIYQYILMAVALMATASCSNELDEALQPVGNGNLQFVVSDFPAFGEGGQTRGVGLEDAGKSAWENGDKILVHLYSNEYGDQAVTLTFGNDEWKSDGGTLSYLNDETPTITAVYAPDCVIKADKTIGLPDGKQYGEAEYILARTSISGNTLDIRFESGRTYSRLRFASMPGATLTVTTGDFTPAGPNGTTAPESYTLTTDDDGNAYLYGTFAINGTVTATANHEIYPEEGITETSRTTAFDDRPSTSGQSYVLGVKLGDWVDAVRAERGDVALKDGSFVSKDNIGSMTTKQKDAMVGIVFWTVVETDTDGRTYPASLTDDKVMNADFPHCTHGLIVSLTNTDAMAWQGTSYSALENIYTTFQNTDLFTPSNVDKSKYASIECILQDAPQTLFQVLGYNHTKVLEAYNQYCRENGKETYIVKPVDNISQFAEQNPAPFGSTGWYLPSPKELHMLCYKDVDNIKETQGIVNKTIINEILENLSSGGNLEDMEYWSSASYIQQALHVDFADSGIANSHKMTNNIVRYVCAF